MPGRTKTGNIFTIHFQKGGGIVVPMYGHVK